MEFRAVNTGYTFTSGARMLGSGIFRSVASGGTNATGTVVIGTPASATAPSNMLTRFENNGSWGASTTIHGIFAWNDEGSVYIPGGQMNVMPGAQLLVSGAGTKGLTGTINNAGTTTWSGGEILVGTNTAFNNLAGGLLEVRTGSRFAPTLRNSGKIEIGSGATGTFGTFDLTLSPNFTQTSTGVLNLDIGGATAGTGYDKLVLGGAATLGGTLNARRASSFRPTAAQRFEVLTYASRSGAFANVNGPFDAAYDANSLELIYDASNNLSISGQLLTPATYNKFPIPEATVVLRRGTVVVAEVKTDRLGNYSIPDLPAGTYTVTPQKTSFTFAPTSSTVTLPRPGTANGAPNATGVNFVGTPRASITGVLMRRQTDGSLAPVVGADIIAYHRDGAIFARTDRNGRYLFDRTGFYPYQILPLVPGTFFRPRVRVVTPNATTPNVKDIDFLVEGTDSSAPQVTVVEPGAGSFTLTSRANIKVSGTASDTGGGNIAAVTVALARFSSTTDATPDAFWNWKNNTFITIDSPVVGEAVAKGTTSWSLLEPTMINDLRTMPAGFYGVRVTVTDGAGNRTRTTWRKFRITNSTRSEVSGELGDTGVTSAVRLSSAQASASGVVLRFSGALDVESATNSANYQVQINGQVVDVESAMYSSEAHTVTLGLGDGSLSVGQLVAISYHLQDVNGANLQGETTLSAR
jgi:hypothetical protein